MNSHASLLVSTLLLAPLSAQQVSATVTVATPVVLSADVGGQVTTTTVPIGTSQATFSANLSAPPSGTTSAGLNYSWALNVSGHEVSLLVGHQVYVLGNSVPASASIGTADLLLTLQASSPVTADIELSRLVTATQSGASITCRIDLGDDGTFEATELLNSPVVLPSIALGAQPLPIRVRTAAAQTGPGLLEMATGVTVRPANNLTILPAVPGCSGLTVFHMEPSFHQQGIELWIDADFPLPIVGVLGLDTQPALLPSPLPTCLLLPRPDYLVLLQPGVPLQVGLPPAVRPLLVWAQGVDFLGAFALATTQSFVAVAN